MQQLRVTVSDPREQLALEEASLVLADQAVLGESFRSWTFDRPVVVLGRSSKVAREVDQEYCEAERIPVLRRCSGGAAVVGGPGCLIYSVVLSLQRRPELQKVDAAHDFVMTRVCKAVGEQLPEVRYQGICDLTWRNRKFSGNSLRIAKHHLLYHGTILHGADLELIARCLREAPRQPEYRGGRDHADFVTNAPLDPVRLAVELADAFGVSGQAEVDGHYREQIAELRRERYDNPQWHLRH